ncbi:MAG: thioredoxin family protein [Chthoniobacterales bacterium]
MSTNALDSIPVGTQIPRFSLSDVLTRHKVTPEEMIASFPKGLLVIFLCRHCPYVKHLQGALVSMAREFLPQRIGFIGISSNDIITYPEDAPESLKEMVQEEQIPFPILFDATQEVAKAFSAVCTPDFFLFDAKLNLAYHGRFDASTPKNGIPVTGADLRLALEATARGETLPEPFHLSLGCSIKWKPE